MQLLLLSHLWLALCQHAGQELLRFLFILCMLQASEVTCQSTMVYELPGQVVLRGWIGDSGTAAQEPRVPVNLVIFGATAAIDFLLSSSDRCLLGVESGAGL